MKQHIFERRRVEMATNKQIDGQMSIDIVTMIIEYHADAIL